MQLPRLSVPSGPCILFSTCTFRYLENAATWLRWGCAKGSCFIKGISAIRRPLKTNNGFVGWFGNTKVSSLKRLTSIIGQSEYPWWPRAAEDGTGLEQKKRSRSEVTSDFKKTFSNESALKTEVLRCWTGRFQLYRPRRLIMKKAHVFLLTKNYP